MSTDTTESSREAEPINFKVLLVDDDQDFLGEACDMLINNGIKPLLAESVIEAEELFAVDQNVSLIITDIKMPGRTGLDLLATLKSRYGNTRPFDSIVITGHASGNQTIEALRLGAVDFLLKPINPKELVAAIKRAQERINARLLSSQNLSFLAEKLQENSKQLEKSQKDIDRLTKAGKGVFDVNDEFLRTANHEFRTPLNVITGVSSLLESGAVDSGSGVGKDMMQKYTTILSEAALRIESLIDGILSYAALKTGTSRFHPVSFRISDFLTTIEGIFSKQFKRKNQLFIVECTPGNLQIVGDQTILIKAVGMLLDNAMKFCPIGAKIELVILNHGEVVEICVVDNGPGMNEEQISIACKPFRQVDGSLTRPVEGMGLGIALAREMVELHGGTLSLISHVGTGTTARIRMTKPKSHIK